MIIVKLVGGLGNQMFQYALGRKLSVEHNTELLLDISWYDSSKDRRYLLDKFYATTKIATKDDIDRVKESSSAKIKNFFRTHHKKSYIKELSSEFDQKMLTVGGKDAYIDGYWQSPKYFLGIEDMIRKEFTLKEKQNEEFNSLLNTIQDENSVSLHIRRADYFAPKNVVLFATCSLEYYQEAVKLISEKVGTIHLFVFSDDIEWTKQHLAFPTPHNVTFVSNGKLVDYQEMMLMSSCKHNITANSTFSWWAAWLNKNPQKVVVSPKKWFIGKTLNDKDLIPETWNRI